MYTTAWREYTSGGRRERIRAKYGIDEEFARRNNQAPYFSITVDIEERRGTLWYDAGGGADHRAVARHFPELKPYLKWHLFSVGEGPMHYLANAKYWWEKMVGVSRWPKSAGEPDPMEAFASTIVLGALHEDTMPPTGPED